MTASAILCPSDSHKDILSSQKTQSGYMIVRWGMLGGKKNNENITKMKKQNGGLVMKGNTGLFVEVGQQESSKLLLFVRHQDN